MPSVYACQQARKTTLYSFDWVGRINRRLFLGSGNWRIRDHIKYRNVVRGNQQADLESTQLDIRARLVNAVLDDGDLRMAGLEKIGIPECKIRTGNIRSSTCA